MPSSMLTWIYGIFYLVLFLPSDASGGAGLLSSDTAPGKSSDSPPDWGWPWAIKQREENRDAEMSIFIFAMDPPGISK